MPLRRPAPRGVSPGGLWRALLVVTTALATGVLAAMPSRAADLPTQLSRHLHGSPVRSGAWTLVTEPDDGLGAIYSLLAGARRDVDLALYELADPHAEGILEEDAHRGVVVHVLLDKDYEGARVNTPAFHVLRRHGVAVRWAYPHEILHEKAVIVDGRAAAVMTLNLTAKYYASSRDFAIITRDASQVKEILQVFGSDWRAAAPYRPHPVTHGLIWSPGSTAPILRLIASARRSLLVENEEMDDAQVERALEAAARRRVRVEVVMTYHSFEAGALRALARAGVHVRTYPNDARLYVHAKVLVIDRLRAFVGSENFSEASLDYDRELGIVTTARPIVTSLSRTLSSDFAGGTPFSIATGGGTR